ncbi:CpsD/CapB family tyrosine-protein kinase [Priestia flexa]|nr:CpsD/CapB family tyrosine-protein kinase [Priestia flexa]MED4588161.1 CpsD/CapB family tyrosine-protein kinase [Priestia flexa]
MGKLFKKRKGVSSSNRLTHIRSLISHKKPKSPISEQYRTIRTNIQFSSIDGEMRSVMVTSTLASEGKSTTAANLAVVFAQQGKRVLLVDADMRKPSIQYTFQLENHIGLTNVLAKQTNLASGIQESHVDNLWVLTSGPIPPNPSELLASQAMESLIQEMYKQFDMVIFDTPPVLPVTDSHILANKCEGVLLVVRSGQTEREAVLKAKDILQKQQGKLLGVVLNGRSEEEGNYYYYYGSGQ